MPENTLGIACEATVASVAYEVRTRAFEGPFDLLLHLILKEEVDLWEISLLPIVDAYLQELQRMEQLDLEVATEFLLIAATLVELKARRLLPTPENVELDEELLRFEERDLLLARLLECKTFKDVAVVVAARLREGSLTHPRRAGPEEPFASLTVDPLDTVTPERLAAAAVRGLSETKQVEVNTDHVAPIRASVAEAVETVLARLTTGTPTTFRELVADVTHRRLDVIVRFLAVLELFKQGLVDVDQASNFATLLIRRLEGQGALDAASLREWEDDAEAVTDDDADLTAEVEAEIDVEIDAQISAQREADIDAERDAAIDAELGVRVDADTDDDDAETEDAPAPWEPADR
jgi:segregation and condensation protein A